jgi:hypothetical protein
MSLPLGKVVEIVVQVRKRRRGSCSNMEGGA